MDGRIIELIDEENRKRKFELVEMIEHDERNFAILAPADSENDEAIVCEIIDEGNDMEIIPVDDRKLLDIIERLYNEMN